MRAFLGGLKNSDEFFEGFLVLRGPICFIYENFYEVTGPGLGFEPAIIDLLVVITTTTNI